MDSIDTQGFEERTMGDTNVQKELFELSVTLFGTYHERLLYAAGTGDLNLIKSIAHKAKTGAMLLGMNNLSAEYCRIEAEAEKMNQLIANVDTMQMLANTFMSASKKLELYINLKK